MIRGSVSYSLVSWNVRGLGLADKCTTVRDTLGAACCDVACLQETKLRATDKIKARSFLPAHLADFSCVDAVGSSGGLATCWNSRSFSLTSFIARRRTLTTLFSSTASDYTFAVTNVYAPADHRDSVAFLEDVEEVAVQVTGNWVLADDFNLTRDESENSNGTVNSSLPVALNDTIHKLELLDLPLLDRLFTWSNHRVNPTMARLDRVFLNVPMSLTFPNSTLTSLPKTNSDHTPIQLTLSTSIPKPNFFRFENCWLRDPGFLPAILPAWNDNAQGCAAASLVRSLKMVRSASKTWARGKRTPPSLHSNCKFVIYLFDLLEEGRCCPQESSYSGRNAENSWRSRSASALPTGNSAGNSEPSVRMTATLGIFMLEQTSGCVRTRSGCWKWTA